MLGVAASHQERRGTIRDVLSIRRAALVLTLLCVAAPTVLHARGQQAADGWFTYMPAGGGFSVFMPLGVKETSEKVVDPKVGPYTTHITAGETELTMAGHPGREFTAESADAFYISRMCMVGADRAYMLVVRVVRGSDDTRNISRFFASFTLK